MSDRARRYWESPRIVAAYARDGRLLPGERALLERVARDGLRPRVLDIGVGAGRTTRFLVPVASRYVGIDLSRRMIETCIARFGESPTVEFRVADARDLPFPDASFEVVLFSYCGIDDLTDPLDRRRAITEMARVATPGGWVALSAHNLNTVVYHFSARRRLAELSWRRPTRIPHVLGHALKAVGGKLINPPPHRLARLETACIRDTLYRGRILKTWYARPDAQIQELEALGLGVDCVLDDEGKPASRESLGSLSAVVPYYLCRKPEDRKR
ncbi:MAG: hypothetical protein C4306_00595 [Thermoleophilia bacterium]